MLEPGWYITRSHSDEVPGGGRPVPLIWIIDGPWQDQTIAWNLARFVEYQVVAAGREESNHTTRSTGRGSRNRMLDFNYRERSHEQLADLERHGIEVRWEERYGFNLASLRDG